MNRGAHIEVAIGELDGEVAGHLVGDACMRGPCKVRLRSAVGEIRRGLNHATPDDSAGVLETIGLDVRKAGTCADERREAPPGSEINVAVDHSDPASIAAIVDVR